jgi:hypothetical protein
MLLAPAACIGGPPAVKLGWPPAQGPLGIM